MATSMERPHRMAVLHKVLSEGKKRIREDLRFAGARRWVLLAVRGGDGKGGIECQCCFSEFSFKKMVQCPEAHLFCSSCVTTYVSTKLGSHDASVDCIDPSGCVLPFPVSELRRVLPGNLMSLYERVKQQNEVDAAGLEGLEDCPFCEWRAVIEVSMEEEMLFRCGNEEGGCGVVSCRACKNQDHLPRSCEEQAQVLDGQHFIEEAMTKALTRNCPHCKKAFIKENGCNMMKCPRCHTRSCYVCREVITDRYGHFSQARTTGNCPAWDSFTVEVRHAQEVKQGAEQAIAEYKHLHPEFDINAIKVDIPATRARN